MVEKLTNQHNYELQNIQDEFQSKIQVFSGNYEIENNWIITNSSRMDFTLSGMVM